MKTFNKICAQGDVLIRRVESIPADVTPEKPRGREIVITHSETGHDHVMEAADTAMYADASNPLIAWLEVKRPTELRHLREFDTHEPIMFPPGTYEIRRQREYTPEGYRRVED